MQDLIKKHLDALAAGNWDEYRAALADNAIYDEAATRQRVEGGDAYMSAIKRWKKAFPDLRARVVESFTVGDREIAEVEWEGTHAGPLEAPFGTIPPTNKRGTLRAVLVFRIENDKIVENHHYFDLFTLMAQLGLAPTLGAPEAAKAAQPTRQA
jgi:steroid delta-isomerase-like uncharacterized protein